VVKTRRMTKRFGDHCVFENIDLVIERGEKVAFVGKNGEGKTTFSRILVGELDYEGESRVGHNVSVGYFAQNQDEIMNENHSVFATIDNVAVGDIRSQTRSILGAFLFHGDDVHKKVKVLSGGERSRLALAQLLLKPYNLLILDEPTNHLDMRSKDILKHALLQYDGTLIVVSHDREFLDGLVEKVYEFGEKNVKEHLGGVYDFLKKKRVSGFKDIERKQKAGKTVVEAKPSGNKHDYEKKKAFDRKKRSLDKKITNTEESISRLEEKIGRLDIIMQEPEKIEDQSVFSEYEKLKSELFQEMTRWEQVHMELERHIEKENK